MSVSQTNFQENILCDVEIGAVEIVGAVEIGTVQIGGQVYLYLFSIRLPLSLPPLVPMAPQQQVPGEVCLVNQTGRVCLRE